MADSLAGVALAAGAGERMHPLTLDRPKVLLPVDGEALIDHALRRLRSVTDAVAVNAHETQTTLHAHVSSMSSGRDGPVHVSVEHSERLGTAGALGEMREWIDGRPTIVVNGDTWCPGGLDALLDGWDGERIRVLVPGPPRFGPSARIAGALLPWRDVRDLEPVPSGLYEVSWRAAAEAGRVEPIGHDGPFVDCADPGDYLRANLLACGGSSIGPTAVVEGKVTDCVVFDGAVVHANERLWRAIRTDTRRTVLVRQ